MGSAESVENELPAGGMPGQLEYRRDLEALNSFLMEVDYWKEQEENQPEKAGDLFLVDSWPGISFGGFLSRRGKLMYISQ